MAKKKSNITTTIKGGFNMFNNTLRHTAMVIIAIIMILSIVATGLFLAFCPDKEAKAKATVTSISTSPDTQSTTIPSVALVDQSSSMNKQITAVAGYDEVYSFSDAIGVIGGDSYITTCATQQLEAGTERLAVVSDLESYPESESNAISGKHFSNVEVTFFVPEKVSQKWLKMYVKNFSNALDSSNCTLKFVDSTGKTVARPFDNYSGSTSGANDSNNFKVTLKSSYEEGNSVPRSVVIIGLEVLFLVIMGLLLVILAICGGCYGVSGQTEIINRALSADSLALDGSGSVSGTYRKFLKYARQAGWGTVLRFASDVKEMSISEAESMQAEGGTAGYYAMKSMFDDGHRVVTIVSDMEFNDEPDNANGVVFDKIYFVGKHLRDSQVAHLKKYCKDFEIVSI